MALRDWLHWEKPQQAQPTANTKPPARPLRDWLTAPAGGQGKAPWQQPNQGEGEGRKPATPSG